MTWVPVFVTARQGRRVVLTGTARARLSETVVAPPSMRATDLQGRPIGRLEAIANESGALTVSFILDSEEAGPGTAEHGGKFLLGLQRQGRHVCTRLAAADGRPGDEPPQRYPGMLGEAY